MPLESSALNEDQVLSFDTMNSLGLLTKISSQLLCGNFRYFKLWESLTANYFTGTWNEKIKAIQEQIALAHIQINEREGKQAEIEARKTAHAYTFLGLVHSAKHLYGKPDYAKARHYFEQAIEHGDSNAIKLLGDMHCNGNGVSRDFDKAIVFYKQAIKLGNSFAKTALACLYRWRVEGDINKDPEAIILYDEALVDDCVAMVERAEMHERRRDHCPLNPLKIIDLLEQAIRLGHPTAMIHRAEKHIKGYGGFPINYSEAIYLLELANALGNDHIPLALCPLLEEQAHNGEIAHEVLERLWDAILAGRHFFRGTLNLLRVYCKTAILEKIKAQIDAVPDLDKLEKLCDPKHTVAKILGIDSTEYRDLLDYKQELKNKAQQFSEFLIFGLERGLLLDFIGIPLGYVIGGVAAQQMEQGMRERPKISNRESAFSEKPNRYVQFQPAEPKAAEKPSLDVVPGLDVTPQ